MEAILVGTNQAKVTGNDTTARKTASVLSWIKSNTSKGATGADPSAADGTGARTDGTQRAFTEANLKTVLQSIWNAGGKPDMIMVGGFNKQAFSSFTGRATPIEDVGSKKIVAAVDVYESDFGRLKVSSPTASSARATCSCCRWRCGRSPTSTAGAWCRSRSRAPATASGGRCCRNTRLSLGTRSPAAPCSTTPRRNAVGPTLPLVGRVARESAPGGGRAVIR